MNDKLYDMMDWARIEGLIYSEEDNPHDLLGAHVTDQGILIQTFIPTAEKITLLCGKPAAAYEMEREDEAGFFAALVPGTRVPEYLFQVTFDDGTQRKIRDPYRFSPVITQEEARQFNAGIYYHAYEKLGAHPMTVDGVDGIYFAVWAPNAMRVSLVGDFNLWDGRRLPMRRLWDSGIFELFVPGLSVGTLYKYEIKARGGMTFLKADPYGFASELRPDTASIVADLNDFTWEDQEWELNRRKRGTGRQPMFICEIHLGSFAVPEDGREFYNYRELAPMIASYVRKSGYTHIELMPVMEYSRDETAGYHTVGFYAPTARYGSPADFMYFINYMHQQGIGVFLDWSPAHFAPDMQGLCGFDGTCLYEHHDPRQGLNPRLGTRIFNYARPEVTSFLIANALFWVKMYHADGIHIENASAMLYLDYDRTDGQWIANMYGGNENLDAVEFLHHLSSIFRKKGAGAVLMAEETSYWPKATKTPEEGGLGFDYKWNDGWSSDFLGYMQLDPVFRGYHHGDLTFSMVYNYSEDFILSISHEEVSGGKGALLVRMPGRKEMKYANVRAVLGYQVVHPGKKLLFMGQELLPFSEWDPREGLDWDQAATRQGEAMQHYISDLLSLYRSQKALYELDYDPDGFEWINNISGNENMLVFLRKGTSEEDMLLIVCNFSPLVYEQHKIGVPMKGSYKEIFNSDREEYGGSGNTNPRAKISRADECDGRPDSIRITVPPMGIAVFRCTRSKSAAGVNDPEESTGKSDGKKDSRGADSESDGREAAISASTEKAASSAKADSSGKDGKKSSAAKSRRRKEKGEETLTLREQLQRKVEQEEKRA